jgi:hypothetical protein
VNVAATGEEVDMRHLTRIIRVLFITVLLSGLAGFAPFPSPAVTINVTTFLDEYADPGPGEGCSLREAITAASSDTAFGGCTTGSVGPDIIQLAVGTYTLTRGGTNEDSNTTGDLDITGGMLSIKGSTSGATIIDGGSIDRVFHIRVGTSLYDLVITHGKTNTAAGGSARGGGIYNTSGLNLDHVQVQFNQTEDGPSNSGGGIYNGGGVITISNQSSIQGNSVGNGNTTGCGGGIYNQVDGIPPNLRGTLDIDHTLIGYNTCGTTSKTVAGIGGNGGGIFSTGTEALVTIDDSVITANQAGDGVAQGAGNGGGIFITGPGAQLVIGRSLIDHNNAGNNSSGNPGGSGGGIAIYDSAIAQITNSTISLNTAGDGTDSNDNRGGYGGGIDNNGILTLIYTTVAGNQTGGGTCDYGCLGGGVYTRPAGSTSLNEAILSDNLASNAGNDCAGNLSATTSLIQTTAGCTVSNDGSLLDVDAGLAGLEINGGPTRTHALLPGSPAIDAGDPASCPSTDQRGFYRPVDGDSVPGALCDIGAYEDGYSQYYVPLIFRP